MPIMGHILTGRPTCPGIGQLYALDARWHCPVGSFNSVSFASSSSKAEYLILYPSRPADTAFISA